MDFMKTVGMIHVSVNAIVEIANFLVSMEQCKICSFERVYKDGLCCVCWYYEYEKQKVIDRIADYQNQNENQVNR